MRISDWSSDVCSSDLINTTARHGGILGFGNFVSADEHLFAIETDIMAVDSTAAGKIVRQQTLKNSIHCSGVALHSGAKVNMVLHPAEADTGLVFRRTDAAGRVAVTALRGTPTDPRRCHHLVDPHAK